MSDQGESQSQPSIKDRIGALLTSQEQPAQPEAEVEAPQQEAQEPAQAEAPEQVEAQEPEAEKATPDDWVEIELEGEKLQVPPKWQKAFLQERDYTQKRQADADYRRTVEAREQGLQVREQALQALQPLYAQAQNIEATLQGYQRLDWDSLRVNDPLDYSTKRADYAALLQQRADLHRNIEQGHAYVNQKSQESLAAQVRAAEPLIRKAIPDWGPEKDAQLTRYAIDSGASPAEITGLAARPWAIPLLEKARKYDELQASKAQLPKRVQQLSPVAKPGAKPTVANAEHALYRKNIEQFRKSGGKDKAALRAVIRAKLGT